MRSIFVPAVGLLFSQATAAPPTLTQVFPPGGQRGATVEVSLKGKFDWPVKVSAPGAVVEVGKEKGNCRITIPADLAADRLWIRAWNEEGASQSAPFLVGSLPCINEQEPNNSTEKAQPVDSAGCAINGVLEKAEVDSFRVELKRGQTLVASLDANTALGSPMDAILQVASPDGFVLAENHDFNGLDPCLVYTARQDGPCIVRVFAFPSTPNSTIAFFGSEACVYRLSMTTGPWMAYTVPFSVSTQRPAPLEPVGWNVSASGRVTVLPWARDDRSLLVERDVGRDLPSANLEPGLAVFDVSPVSCRVSRVPYDVAIRAPGVDGSSPPLLTVPGGVSGRFQSRGETHQYRVVLDKGQEFEAIAEERGLGAPLGLMMKLIDPAGQSVAQWDDLNPRRSAPLKHTAKGAGEYRLEIQPRRRPGRDRVDYEIHALRPQPDFVLEAKDETVTVTKEKPAEISLTVRREGNGIGPITIEAAGLPEGVTATSVISEPSGPSAGKVSLKFESNGAGWSGPVLILGHAEQPTRLDRFARTAPRLGATFDSLWLTAVAGKSESAGSP
jgi:hypothetical protein